MFFNCTHELNLHQISYNNFSKSIKDTNSYKD